MFELEFVVGPVSDIGAIFATHCGDPTVTGTAGAVGAIHAAYGAAVAYDMSGGTRTSADYRVRYLHAGETFPWVYYTAVGDPDIGIRVYPTSNGRMSWDYMTGGAN